MNKYADIARFEIFEHEPGRDPYDEDALDKIVASFSGEGTHGTIRTKLGKTLNVPLVIGHEDDQKLLKDSGITAAGWVEQIWREGRKLVGRASRVTQEVAAMINAKSLRHVSAEIYKDFEKIGPALRRVALLGGDIPAKKTLGELAVQTYIEDGLEFDRITNRFSETSEMDELKKLQADFDALKAEKDKADESLTAQKTELEGLKEKIAEMEKDEEDDKDLATKFSEMETANKAQKSAIDSLRGELKDIQSTRNEEHILALASDLAREKNVYNEDLKSSWVDFAKGLPADKVDPYFESLKASVAKTVDTGSGKARTQEEESADDAKLKKEYDAWSERNNHTDEARKEFSFEWYKETC